MLHTVHHLEDLLFLVSIVLRVFCGLCCEVSCYIPQYRTIGQSESFLSYNSFWGHEHGLSREHGMSL